MERIIDKAIVLACCLAAAGCELAASGQTDPESMLPFAVAMLAAMGCALVSEIVPSPWALAAPCVYRLAACFAPFAAAFSPLVAYDLVRAAHAADRSRLLCVLPAIAFVSCVAQGKLALLSVGVLACALAASCALSVRTTRAAARTAVAHITCDSMELQARTLRSRNKELASEVQKLHEAHEDDAVEGDAEATRPAAFACLTEREYEVARLVAEGLDNRDIAATAYLSEGTVRNNISSILSKMGLKNRTQIAVAFYKGLR